MLANQETWPVRHLFDVRIDAMSTNDVLAAVDEAISARRRLLIGVVNAAKLVRMNRDEALRRAVLGADLIVADGISVVWASRLLLRRLPERVAGIDLMTRMLRQADDRGYRVYCLGASEEVLLKVTERIRKEYPRAVLVGARSGYYAAEEEEDIAKEIAAARPDLLFVGMTSPKKEKFLATWASVMNVPVCHGVGGAFDVMAGKVKRAPRLWQRLGLEWLYRAIQEPNRLGRRYLVTNTLFLWMLAREAARGLRRAVSVPGVSGQVAWSRAWGS
ncbi:MAG: WecB/TagA/CpsF family glycosyltransferase [Phycisphaerae bacterium]|nr:WecB/TagA/CpsF family glycosyltransferase [Phycisphaerae bacterium]